MIDLDDATVTVLRTWERFQRAVARHAPATSTRVLAPGEPLELDG